jgi:hypothetical protein
LGAHTDLGVHGIDGDGADGDEKIVGQRSGLGKFEIEEGLGIRGR